jgi:preprotein translocase subunit SecD
MREKLKKIFTNWRVLMLLFFLLASLIAISPRPWQEGLAMRSIEFNSSAYLAGMQPPKPADQPVARERILTVNNLPVFTLEDYEKATGGLPINATVYVKTNKQTYRLRTKEAFETVVLNETHLVTVEELVVANETINGTTQLVAKTINVTKEVPKTLRLGKGTEDLGLRLYSAPKSNLKKGLDLQGGTRVLLQPEVLLAPEDLGSLIDTMTERLNVYGLSDIIVREAGDLSGNQYILVEVAGASEAEIRELLAKQGKFEAKIDSKTVFQGGQDITYVCRSANCAGIDPNRGCFSDSGQSVCGFAFSITLSRAAAEKQAAATSTLEVVPSTTGSYLSKPLELYLDDQKVDELNIGADLKGQATTQIQISGSGAGPNQDAATFNALQNMKRLQTILITGSLPVKLNIVKVDAISPVLGEGFLQNALLIAAAAIIAVSIAVAIRYKTVALSSLIIITMVSEIIIVLGAAALIKWNLDLIAIAGIIAAIGTGVDHQIVIADETLRGTREASSNWKDRIKRAFVIIMLSYFTVVVALFPLLIAGAGLLKGFAIVTILGGFIGVFITRPAFSQLLEIILK